MGNYFEDRQDPIYLKNEKAMYLIIDVYLKLGICDFYARKVPWIDTCKTLYKQF